MPGLPVCFVCFATKQVVLFIEAATVSTPYCYNLYIATSNQISRTDDALHGSGVYRRKSRVYERKNPEQLRRGSCGSSCESRTKSGYFFQDQYHPCK